MGRGRFVRLLILLWLAWYLPGPICEVVDFWDSPAEEMQDVAFHGGGALSLAAAAFGVALANKTRTLYRVLARAARVIEAARSGPALLICVIARTIPQGVSPPVPLRI